MNWLLKHCLIALSEEKEIKNNWRFLLRGSSRDLLKGQNYYCSFLLEKNPFYYFQQIHDDYLLIVEHFYSEKGMIFS